MTDFGASSYHRDLRSDPAALEALIRTYSDALVRFAYCYVKDAATAEDIMEEAFATLLMKRRHFPTEGHLRAYLYRTARSRAVDYLRRHRNEVPLEDVQNVLCSGDLETDLIRRQCRQTIYLCIQSLPPQYREVLQLTYFDGFSVAEVCGIMKKSSKQVYNLLSRAKTALKALLEKEGISHEDL